MSDNKEFKPIRAADAVDLVSWDLPQMSGPVSVGLQQKAGSEVTVVEEVLAAEKITVAELEEIRENARIEGLAAGLEEGRLKGIEEGRQQGQREGYDAGYAEGLAKSDDDLKRAQSLLGQLVLEFENPLNTSASMLEACLLELVVSMSESVVQAELTERKGLLLDSIRDSLRMIPEPLGRVIIKVHPDDSAYLEPLLQVPGVAAELIPDPQVQVGGYLLEAENTIVKHEVEERFAEAVAQLKANMLTQADQGDE